MPAYFTSIKLASATEKDYEILSREMERQSFRPVNKPKMRGSKTITVPISFHSNIRPSLLDASAAITHAASATGKKYSFTIMKDKSN
jgi:hypothetical protein